MERLVWKDDYSIDGDLIDRQHRRLFEIFNDYSEDHAEGEGREATEAVLRALAAYADEHFDREEELMEEKGYPELEEHRKEHERFKADLSQRVVDFQEGDAMAAVKVMQDVRQWLFNHITDHTEGQDQRFGHWLKHGTLPGEPESDDEESGGEEAPAPEDGGHGPSGETDVVDESSGNDGAR